MANVQRRTGPANNCERELGHIWTEAKTIYHEEMELHFEEIKEAMNNLKRHEGPPDPAFQSLCQESQSKNALQLQSYHKSVVTELLSKFNQEYSLDFDQRRKLRSALEFQLEKYNHDLKLLTNSTSRPVLGIDLGTTYCCVAAYHNGSIKIVTNAIGKNTTPSIIAFDGAHSFIGQPAKDQAHMNPQNTIFDAKRLIGRKFLDPIVQKDLELWPFAVVSDQENNRENPKITVEEGSYHPEEISGEILKVLKADAESFLGGIPVTDAVITVPAYFNNGQRKATRNAGAIAGLNVLQILNEPTAAAITYSLDRVEQSKRNVLIFDLGGGTFDVSVLTIENGSIQIKAVGGDTHLGGEDFDNSMVDFCISDFKRKTGLDIREGKDSLDEAKKFKASKRLRRLRNECEKQKVALSFAPRAIVAIDSIQDGEDLQVTFTRENFEQLIEDKLLQCIETVDQVIWDIDGIQKQDIDDIVLVGGSSRIPKIQKMLQDYFERDDLRKSVHPDEAVAHGAAIRACLLSEGAEHDKLKESLTISDVIPLSVGIQIRDGDFSRIIPKNTPIPFSITKKYVTRYDNQTVMRLPIYEGDDKLAKKNHYLGEIQLENIPPGPAGAEQCEVVMKINSDGIFTVEATALGNAESQKGIQISMYFDRPQRDEVGVFEKADDLEPRKNAWYV